MPAPPPVAAGFDAFAVAAPGLAPLVAAELTALGIAVRETSDAGVSFDATAESLAAANLWLRTASRVIVRLASFEARDFATLEKAAMRVPWARVLREGGQATLRVTCRKSRLYHSDAVAQRVARGIERTVRGARVVDGAGDDDAIDATDISETADELLPSSPDGDAPQRVLVRFEHDRCTISADTSGALLHRRGWRQAVAKAPLRETLAAAMLRASGWNGVTPLVDPFCGSGTIGIEAALLARNIAPGIARAFAMERWPGMDTAIMAAARAAARAGEKPAAGVPIVMSDRDAGAVAATRANAERAGVLGDLTIAQHALSDVALEAIGTEGLLLTNPPYGLRVGDGSDLRALYARLGDVLRSGGRAWRLGLLVPDRKLAGQLKLSLETGLRTSNGGIPVALEMTRAVPTAGKTKN